MTTALRFLPLLLVVAAPAVAQEDGLSVTASLRVRGEAIDGQPRAVGPESDAAIFSQTRLGAEYRRGVVSIGGELIDSRAFFERVDSTVADTEVNALEPMQAWIGLDVAPGARARVGRFNLNLGSRRLVAENNYRNTINAFTGGRIDWQARATRATVFWTLPHDRLPDDPERIRRDAAQLDRERTALQFFGAFAQTEVAGTTVEFYTYRLAERDASGFATRDRRLWTPGVRVLLPPKVGRFDGEVEAAWQVGEARATTAASDTRDRRVAAHLVRAAIGYTVPVSWSPRIQFALDIASGQGPGPTLGRFDTLYGARVFEYGPTGLLGAVSRANLLSPDARVEVAPSNRWTAHLAARPLWLAESSDSFGATAVRDPSGVSGRYAGTQVEGRVRHWLSPDRLRLAVGAVLLAKGRLLRSAPNAPDTGDTHYGFVELLFTP